MLGRRRRNAKLNDVLPLLTFLVKFETVEIGAWLNDLLASFEKLAPTQFSVYL